MATKMDPNVEEATPEFRAKFQALRDEIGKMIVGHADVVDGVLTALLTGGHILLPGDGADRRGGAGLFLGRTGPRADGFEGK